MNTSHRRALLPQIDKLYDERVLLGDGIGSREMIRYVDLIHHNFSVSVCCV